MKLGIATSTILAFKIMEYKIRYSIRISIPTDSVNWYKYAGKTPCYAALPSLNYVYPIPRIGNGHGTDVALISLPTLGISRQ